MLNERIKDCIDTQNVFALSQMLDEGLDIRHTNENGVSLLYQAVLTSDMPAMVRMLIGRGAQVDQVWDPYPLHKLNKGAKKIMTPLTISIELSHHENAAALLDCGADPNLTWLTCGCEPSDEQSVNLSDMPLYLAMKYEKSAPSLRPLLNAGASLAQFTKIAGMPPLNHCVLQNNLEAIKVLLAFGQDPRQVETKTGKNALELALKTHEDEVGKESYAAFATNEISRKMIISTLHAWMDCQSARDAIDIVMKQSVSARRP